MNRFYDSNALEDSIKVSGITAMLYSRKQVEEFAQSHEFNEWQDLNTANLGTECARLSLPGPKTQSS